MTYVLFATSRFGALALEALVQAGFPPVAVISTPDRPAGRKQALTPTPAKAAAQRLGIPVLDPERLADIHDQLRALGADVFVVASFGRILRPDLVAIPPRGVVGIHPSLLPLYRGPAPIQQAVLDGVAETGVTLFLVDDDSIDHGPVLAQERIAVPDSETLFDLEARLARLGATMAARELPRYVAGAIAPQPQEHGRATFTRKFSSADGFVPWEDLRAAYAGDGQRARAIRNMIGGFTPEPGAWTERDGIRIKLLAGEVRDGRLRITRYQKAGKLPQDVVLEA